MRRRVVTLRTTPDFGKQCALVRSCRCALGAIEQRMKRDIVRGQIFEWQVDSPPLRILLHIAKNVGELKRNPCFFGELFC